MDASISKEVVSTSRLYDFLPPPDPEKDEAAKADREEPDSKYCMCVASEHWVNDMFVNGLALI